MDAYAVRVLAFQIASQLPGNPDDARAVLALAGELIRHAATLEPAAVVPFRTV
jgi:hypothetical protein